ncbi:MAG: ABC transporter permease [Candidatus Acidiferrales bacterium]
MNWFSRSKWEQEASEELRDHIERQTAANIAAGMTAQEARRQAVLQMGAMEGVKEDCREQRRGFWLETLWADARYGVRLMMRSPGFTIVAVLTLALGIGANTAIFSIVNAVLLSPLPFPHPEQLVTLHESKPNFQTGSISYPNFRDWQRNNTTFSSIAVSRALSFSLTGAGEAEQVFAEFISSDFFPLLGVNPVIGRQLAPGEDEVGAAPVVLINERLWKRKFGGSPGVLGKTIALDANGFTVVGVIPTSLDLTLRGFRQSDVYVPIGQNKNPLLLSRGSGLGIHGIGRLKPGVTIEQARADMANVTRALAEAYPDSDKGIGAALIPLRQDMVAGVRPFLLIMLAAVCFVLLIACVNVANLQLARSTARAREFAIRSTLGATQSRLIRQLLTESLLLSLVGGALGLALAAWGTRVALAKLPFTLPRAAGIGIDWRVLGFTIAVSLLSGIVFGLAPALKTRKPILHETLKESGRGTSGTLHRTQSIFVVVEMALALVLLAGAGLMLRTLAQLWGVDPGFNSKNVVTFNLSLPPSLMNASPEAVRAAYREIDRRFASVPGVQAISMIWGATPMAGDDETLFWIEGQPKPASQNEMNWTVNYIVEPDYLQVMQISLKRGRFFTPQDDEHAHRVVVIDEVLARKYFPGQDPVGKVIHVSGFGTDEDAAEIVGVVGHVIQWSLASDAQQTLQAQLYRPCAQMHDDFIILTSYGTNMIVRSAGNQTGLMDSIRNVNKQINGDQVIYGVQTMDEIISDTIQDQRFSMILLGAFAALALLLASVGIYGVVSYLVGQRTREIGIRVALGAQRRDVLHLVLAGGLRMTLLGVAIGTAAALALTRLMANLLFGVSATDPLTFAAVGLLLTLVALAACYIPARRATRVDPMTALRYE